MHHAPRLIVRIGGDAVDHAVGGGQHRGADAVLDVEAAMPVQACPPPWTP
jgi:hypothetical protein